MRAMVVDREPAALAPEHADLAAFDEKRPATCRLECRRPVPAKVVSAYGNQHVSCAPRRQQFGCQPRRLQSSSCPFVGKTNSQRKDAKAQRFAEIIPVAGQSEVLRRLLEFVSGPEFHHPLCGFASCAFALKIVLQNHSLGEPHDDDVSISSPFRQRLSAGS